MEENWNVLLEMSASAICELHAVLRVQVDPNTSGELSSRRYRMPRDSFGAFPPYGFR